MAEIVLFAGNDDNDNDYSRIQDALDHVEDAGGGVVRLAAGPTTDATKFYLGPKGGTPPPPAPAEIYPLGIGDNVALRPDHGITLVRRFCGGGRRQATIINKGGEAGNTNIRISGGAITTEGTTDNFIGKHLSFDNVQGLSIDNVQFPQVYRAWTAFFRDCEDVTISNVTIGNGDFIDELITEDGLHFAGGARIAVTNCNIYCGDDCIALVHEGPGDALPTKPLTDVVVSNCTLRSVLANAFKAYVGPGVTLTISRVRVANIVAKIGAPEESGLGIDIRDDNDADRVSDVEIDGFTLDASQNDNYGFQIKGVSHVRLANVTVLQPMLGTIIDGSDDVELRNVVVNTPRTQYEYPCLMVAATADCANVRILGGSYSNSPAHGIDLGVYGETNNAKVTGFEVSGALIEGAKLHGLLLWNAFDGIVIGNTITGSGAGGQLGLWNLRDAAVFWSKPHSWQLAGRQLQRACLVF